jgi:hypothetical protein
MYVRPFPLLLVEKWMVVVLIRPNCLVERNIIMIIKRKVIRISDTHTYDKSKGLFAEIESL